MNYALKQKLRRLNSWQNNQTVAAQRGLQRLSKEQLDKIEFERSRAQIRADIERHHQECRKPNN